MPVNSVTLPPGSQGVPQANPIEAGPKGGLKLQKGQIEPLPPGKHGFASIDNAQIQGSLRFNMAEGQKQKTASEKITHIHKVAFATGRTDELPSVRKFWNGFKTTVADSAIGRFVQRNILHHVANTKINSLDVKAQAADNKKTTLRFELKAQKPSGENTHRIEGPEPKGHEIEVTFDRLRNQRSWFNPKRWIGNDHRTGQVVDILAKLQVDVSRQVRLRNLGIGLEQEKTFAANNPGLLAALPEATPKKGVKPPNASDYAKSELQNFKTAAGELGKADWIPLLDKAIGADSPKAPKLSKNELAELRKIALTVEFQKLDAIRRVCGDYAFTDKQIADLDRLAAALESGDPGALDKTITSLATSLREMSIMAWSAMVPRDETNGGSYAPALERLLAGKAEGILPMEVLMSPCFMSPQALRKQAANMEYYANTTLQKNETTANKLAALEEKFQAIGQSNAESRKKAADLQGRATGIKDIFLENAKHLREIAESSAGMYRFQGMLPILAGANGEQLQSFIQQKLDSVFQQTTGLQPANRLGQVAAAAGGGALTVAAAFKGNVAGAAAAGAASLIAVKYLEHDGSKYSGRLQALSDAILGGIASGSEEQLIQANRLIAEEKCDQSVQKWATNHQGEIQTHSRKVGQEEDINNCSESLSNLAANNNLGRSAETEKIRGILGQKIEGLAKLEGEIQKTNSSIDQGPAAKVKIHSELTVDQVKAQGNVQKQLSNAGKSVDSECKALKGSFEILQSAYQNEGKESGRYFKQITGVEDSIANSIKNWKAGGDHGIAQGMAGIRDGLSKDAPKLTNSHATHLHDLAGHLEKAAGKAQDLQSTMLKVGRGLASPSLEYMSGSLDKNVFQEGAQFVEAGRFSSDLGKLEIAKTAVGEGGKNPYALFRDKESREAISEPVGELLQDAKKSQESWKKCLASSSAMVGAAQTSSDIHKLKSALNDSAGQLETNSSDLQQISEKYKDLQPNGPRFDFATNIKNLHEASLRTGVARLVGLDQVPPPEECRGALDLLSGPLADPDLHKSVEKYLAQSENKAEALKDLFSKLPPTGKSPSDWTPGDTDAWKAKLADKATGLGFLEKLFNYEEGGDELGSALKTAKMVSSGETQKSIIADLYSAPIQSFLDKAANNEELQRVFPAQFKSGDLNPLFQRLADNIDTLASYGLDANLKDKAGSVADLFTKFQDRTSRPNLEGSDFETLLKFSKVLADLKATPKATLQHQLRLAALTLLANVDPAAFQDIKEPQSADLKKLKDAFTPKPANLAEWEKFKKDYKTAYSQYENLQKFVNDAETVKNGSKLLYEKLGGKTDLLNLNSKDAQERRENLLVAHQLYSSSASMAKFNNSPSLANKHAVLSKKEAEKELNKSGIDFKVLKWTNVDTCQEDESLKELDQKIQKEQSESNQFLNYRQAQSGIYNELRRVYSKDVSDWMGKHGKRPSDETPLDTLTRIFAKSGDEFFSDRLNALRNYLEFDKQLQEYSPKLEEAKSEVKKSEEKRDELLGEHQSIVFKNAVRAAILTYCVDKGVTPGSLEPNPHESEIKTLLGTYGWSEDTYPAGLSIQKYFSEAKQDGFLGLWTKEAGNMRHDLSRIEEQIAFAIGELKNSLVRLNDEINKALESKVTDIKNECNDLSWKGGSLLDAARGHTANLVGSPQIPNNQDIAKQAITGFADRLKKSHPAESQKIDKWAEELSKSIQPDRHWSDISYEIGREIDKIQHQILGTDNAEPLGYHKNLAALRELEFNTIADRIITGHFDSMVGKAHEAYQAIWTAKLNFNSLRAKDSLPKNMISGDDGKPRSWVDMYARGEGLDSKKVAVDFEEMHPLEFLGLFTEGRPLQRFFAKKQADKPNEVKSLTSYMQGLRDAFDQMGNALDNFELEKYTAAVHKARAVLENPQCPTVTIAGGDRLNSIGNILKEPANLKPLGEAWNTIQVPKEQLIIRSEQEFERVNQIFSEKIQEIDEQGSEVALDDFELGEGDPSSNRAGGDFYLDENENPAQASARNSGQAGLMQFAMQESFSNRRSQQIEQLEQNLPPGIPN